MKIKIYIPYHKKFSLMLQNGIFQPIHVGKELSDENLWFIWDNTWDNISIKNKNYCELTAMYWVWKNTKPCDYVWFFHYRRFLAFNYNGNYIQKIIRKITPTKYYLFDNIEDISKQIEWFDILLPRKNYSFWSLYSEYSRFANESDIKIIIEIIKKNILNIHLRLKKFFLRNLIFFWIWGIILIYL